MTRGKMWGKIKSWCEQQLEAASAEQFWPAYKRVDVRGQPPVPHLRFALPIKEGEAWGSSPVVLFWIEVYQLLETANFNPPGIWIAVWQRTEASRTHGPHVVGFTTDGDIQENTFNNGGLFWRAVEHLVGSGRAATPMLPPLSPSGQADQPVHKRAEANDQAAQPQPAGVIEYDAGGNLRLCSYQPGDDDLTRYLPLLQVAPKAGSGGLRMPKMRLAGC